MEIESFCDYSRRNKTKEIVELVLVPPSPLPCKSLWASFFIARLGEEGGNNFNIFLIHKYHSLVRCKENYNQNLFQLALIWNHMHLKHLLLKSSLYASLEQLHGELKNHLIHMKGITIWALSRREARWNRHVFEDADNLHLNKKALWSFIIQGHPSLSREFAAFHLTWLLSDNK